VTEYLNYDFQIKPKKRVKQEVTEVLQKICNSDDDDFNFIMQFLGYCITSETKEQKYLNAVGPSASNGKSTLIKLMESALSIYVFKAKKDLFSEGFSKGHKFFAQTKNKRIVYIEEQDKKKVDADLMKDVVDGNKMNNEVLFSTTEKIDINFKLLFFSNNLMNFDADSGIKRRLIHFEFKNKFVDKEELEKEKEKHKIGNVFEVDRTLLTKFNESDDYKNALIHIIISKSKEYFEKGLTIPRKYIEIANDVCEDNDKFKNFFDCHFEITNVETDRISKDEIHEIYNRHSKCNFSSASITTDIKRLQLNYQRGLCSMFNGSSRRGVVVGIKHKTQDEQAPAQQEPNDLDFGVESFVNYERKYNELKVEHEKMRLEFEAFKKLHETKPEPEPEPELRDEDETEEPDELDFDDVFEKAPIVENKVIAKSTVQKIKTKL
jgi:hypothetical protein